MAKSLEHLRAMKAEAPSRKESFGRKLIKQRQLLMMSVPAILVVIVFTYMPLWGWIMAFQKYKIAKGIWNSPFVGFNNFTLLFKDDQFFNVFRNTVCYGIVKSDHQLCRGNRVGVTVE